MSEKYDNDIADYIASQIKCSGTILEYGCGFGPNLRKLEEKLDESCKIYGLDISSLALKEGANYIHGRAVLQKVDGTRIPFDNDFFDLSFTAAVLEHVPKKDFVKICDELVRVTKKTIIHIEASRTYYTKFPHDYKKFYAQKGYPVKFFKLPGFDETFTWYQISLDGEKIQTMI